VLAPPPLTKDYISVVNAHLINDLKLQIKKVLNMHPDNRTLDKYVTQVFNVKSVNPTYVFVLPDHKDRTLVLRRSDFNEAVFPNVTNLNKFKKSPLNPKGDEPTRGTVNEEASDLDGAVDEDYDESQMGRIIEENIRTERNFIEFVDNLNDDLEEEYESSQLSDRYQYSLGQESKISTTKVKAIVDLKRKRIQNSKKIDWKDLGLDGWFGGLSPVVNEFDTTLERWVAIKIISNILRTLSFILVQKQLVTKPRPTYSPTCRRSRTSHTCPFRGTRRRVRYPTLAILLSNF
jgi:hypothetical protein